MEHIVVTGATGGIGLEFCRHYAAKSDKVTAICRQKNAELEALGVDILDQVDLGQDASYQKLAKYFEGKPIDLLINNAGVLHSDNLENFSVEQIRHQFELNAIAPLRVTQAVLPSLAKGSKIAMITSRMGSMADNTSGGYYGYRASKAALNMFTVSLAHDLKNRQIWVAAIHPGFVKTKMTNMNGDLKPEQSVAGITKIIEAAKLDESGSFWHTNGERLPW
ncbi:MAG: SDR family oxidoreductase [Oligoflexus sp.]